MRFVAVTVGESERVNYRRTQKSKRIACGRNDESFAWLNRAIDEGQSFFGVKTEIFLDALHADPRWEEVLTKAGVSARQTASIVI